jgi:hypothetical protein
MQATHAFPKKQNSARIFPVPARTYFPSETQEIGVCISKLYPLISCKIISKGDNAHHKLTSSYEGSNHTSTVTLPIYWMYKNDKKYIRLQ